MEHLIPTGVPLSSGYGSSGPAGSPETLQANYFRNAAFKGFENLFFQYRQGLITADSWASYEFIIRANVGPLNISEWWIRSRPGFDTDFQARVDGILRESAAELQA